MHGKPNTALRLPAALFTQLATIRWLPVHFFLPVLCGYIPRIGLDILLVLFLIAPLAAQEKQTTYQFQNISFLSLNAAEEYMRHNTWYGGQPAPSANWIQYLKRQQVSPGAGRSYLEYGFRRAPYKEVPGFLAYMSDVAPDCGDCPIYDAFGKDFCTANIYHFAAPTAPSSILFCKTAHGRNARRQLFPIPHMPRSWTPLPESRLFFNFPMTQ